MSSTTKTRPSRRENVTYEISVGGQEIFFSVGLYEDGKPMEIFIDLAKEGSTVRALYGQIGRLVSEGWQNGVAVVEAVRKWRGARFEQSGVGRGHPAIEGQHCDSPLDGIARVLEAEYA